MAVAGVGEPQGEFAVVGEQEGAAAVGIEATHRMQTAAPAQLRRQQVEHGGTAVGVPAGAEHADGLVEQERQGRGGKHQGLTIDTDAVGGGIGPIAEPGQVPVDLDAALPQPCLRLPA